MKEKIIKKLQDYLEEHKGIAPSLLADECPLAHFGFSAAEWNCICEDLTELFDIGGCNWPNDKTINVKEWVVFIEAELKKRKVVQIWNDEKIYQTEYGCFWEYYGFKKIEIRRKKPLRENDFYEYYRVHQRDFVYAKNPYRKIIDSAATTWITFLESFILRVAQSSLNKNWYNAKSVRIYTLEENSYLLGLPEGNLICNSILFSNGLLSLVVDNNRYFFELKENEAAVISHEEFKERYKPPFSDFNWHSADDVIAAQIRTLLK